MLTYYRLNRRARRQLTLAVVFSLLFLSYSVARAATSVSTNRTGQCLKPGDAVTISWSSDDASYDHVYLSESINGSHSSYPQSASIGHPISGSSTGWTAPNVTSNNVAVYGESHNIGHLVLSSTTSPSFSVDNSPPGAPAPTVASRTTSSINLSWPAVSDVGCEGLRGYKVYRDGGLVSSGTATTFSDTGLAANSAHSYRVDAFDNFTTTAGSSVSGSTDKPSTAPTTSTTTTTTPSGSAPKPAATTTDTPLPANTQPAEDKTTSKDVPQIASKPKTVSRSAYLPWAMGGAGLIILFGALGYGWFKLIRGMKSP